MYSLKNEAGSLVHPTTNDSPFRATLREETDGIYFSALKSEQLSEQQGFSMPSSRYEFSASKSATIAPNYFFSKNEATADANGNETFSYRQWRLYLQGMTIPIKFRSKTADQKAQVETGPTLALAPGFKHSWVKYLGQKNSLGQTNTIFSISTGLLFGVGTVDINAKTTLGKVLDADATKNVIIPVGLHFTLGINSINVGIAYGTDVITGPNRTSWSYFGKGWTGIIVGLDIIK